MSNLTLIANTGIHISSFEMEINLKERYSLVFHEWYNTELGNWTLDLVHELDTEDGLYSYKKQELSQNGYFAEGQGEIKVSDLREDNIFPIAIDNDMQGIVGGVIYKMTFADKGNCMRDFENQWLPLPYFKRMGNKLFKFGALNWSRFMLVPMESNGNMMRYKVLLAFDTRTAQQNNKYAECPFFDDQYKTEMLFDVCADQYKLMDYCSPSPEWKYVNDHLFHLAHPGVAGVAALRDDCRLKYIASYVLLIDYIAQKKLFPQVCLYRDDHVEVKDIDMVVDIGNSQTTALLVEDNNNFNQVCQLRLIDFTQLTTNVLSDAIYYEEPFDMRLAFRKVDFGNFGIKDSRQFVYPSFVRLGREANHLIHRAVNNTTTERLSTLSSPKRYLWDNRKSREEWQFMVLEGEEDDHVLTIPGISCYLRSDGQIDRSGAGGQTYHFSRQSLMSLAFLEMMTQALMQVNSHQYRTDRGSGNMPRRLRRIIVTCPTAMSKVERDALVRCATNASFLLSKYVGQQRPIEVVPAAPSLRDSDPHWYYDEATCSQLVYVYGEVGYKYRGQCQEFFNLYGRGDSSLTIGSLDIGAGTSDLMISQYRYTKDTVTTISPNPVFYDSFYYAGDDMLHDMLSKVMFFSPKSGLRQKLKHLSEIAYRQHLRDFFGPDHAGQTVADRQLRRDFNMQYSVPLMYHFLELLSGASKNKIVSYEDVFADCPPNQSVLDGFERFFGFRAESLQWEYDSQYVYEVVAKAFEPLLKKIAAILFAHGCDIVLLSGRPASLAPIREIFLKYYAVSPNRLICLNNYYVGHWYPFDRNTGSISNPKTIVAMGALIAYYATSLSNLQNFSIDASLLDQNLRSVINYVELPQDTLQTEYVLTPQNTSGEIKLLSLPSRLHVRQLNHPSYPSRMLYVVDFNQAKIADQIKGQYSSKGKYVGDAQLLSLVAEKVADLRKLLPFTITIERDIDDKEHLAIVSVVDRNGNDVQPSYVEISTQSLNADGRYWLDTGAFEIQ